MPEGPGAIGHKPGGGSFVNTGEMVNKIKKNKELASLEQTKDRHEEEAADAEEKKQDEEIQELLPKVVTTAFGDVPYATFKELYADVFQAVADKDHWALGYVAHELEIYDGVTARVRTLRKREADVLRGTAPSGNVDTFNEEQSEYETTRLLICLQQFGGNVYQDDVKLSLETFPDWRKGEKAKARAELIDNLPDEIVAFLGAVINDTMMGYRCAMTENLKNRLAPLSRTTASD